MFNVDQAAAEPTRREATANFMVVFLITGVDITMNLRKVLMREGRYRKIAEEGASCYSRLLLK